MNQKNSFILLVMRIFYKDHFDVVKTQIEREPLPLPHLVLNKDIDNLFDFKIEDIKLEGYQSHGPLKGKVSV